MAPLKRFIISIFYTHLLYTVIGHHYTNSVFIQQIKIVRIVSNKQTLTGYNFDVHTVDILPINVSFLLQSDNGLIY